MQRHAVALRFLVLLSGITRSCFAQIQSLSDYGVFPGAYSPGLGLEYNCAIAGQPWSPMSYQPNGYGRELGYGLGYDQGSQGYGASGVYGGGPGLNGIGYERGSGYGGGYDRDFGFGYGFGGGSASANGMAPRYGSVESPAGYNTPIGRYGPGSTSNPYAIAPPPQQNRLISNNNENTNTNINISNDMRKPRRGRLADRLLGIQ